MGPLLLGGGRAETKSTDFFPLVFAQRYKGPLDLISLLISRFGCLLTILSTAAVVAVVRGAAVLADFDLAAHSHLSLLGGDIPPTP